MKQIFLALVACLVLAGCQSQPVEQPAPEDGLEPGFVEQDRAQTVELVLPETLFEDMDPETFDPAEYAAGQDFLSAQLHQDGSMTVVMTAQRHQDILEDMAARYGESFAALVAAPEMPYLLDITYTEDFSRFTIDVDREAYEQTIDVTPMAVGVAGMLYQTFTAQEPQVEVTVRDGETGDVLRTIVYPDALGAD